MESLLGIQEIKEEDRSIGYKLVPWLSWDEWNFVSESLFSSSPDSVADALRRISGWRSRGCLPVVIEVTASIVEIRQKDPFFRENCDYEPDKDPFANMIFKFRPSHYEAEVPIGSISSRGELRLLRRCGSEDSGGSRPESLVKMSQDSAVLLKEGRVCSMKVNWEGWSGQDGVGVQAASRSEPVGSSQLVSRVSDSVEEESVSSLEEGASCRDEVNQCSESDNSLEGSSDEEGLWRLQGAESKWRLVNGVVEKTRKKTEVSIAEAADAIGIPRMLIDIRHEGSHRDLPSLHLVRLASIKALEWLKYYYWEPQKNAIPYQRDGTVNARKEIRSRLRELAFYINLMQAPQLDSSLIKERRVKQCELLRGHNKFFSRMAGNFKSSKSGGYKKQVSRTLRNLVQLYSSFPSEVVSVLLELLLKACDSSISNEVESCNNSQVDPSPGNSGTITVSSDDWKLVIMRLSSKVPELLLTMLQAVLEMIKTREAMKSEIGKIFGIVSLLFFFKWRIIQFYVDGSLGHRAEIRQIEHLSSLVTWLVRNLKEAKPMSHRGTAAEIQVSLAEADLPKATLTELLRKCLLILAPANNQLMDSALLLAHMIGNSSMIERLKKLSLLSLPSLDCTDESSEKTDVEHILLQQEDSISRAAEKLEFLKVSRMKVKMVNTEQNNDDVGKEKTAWTVAKSWNSCPIGMLPRDFGSSGILPVLDRVGDQQEVQKLTESKEHWVLNRCSTKSELSCDAELLENSSVVKKMRETVEDGELYGENALSLGSVEGQLMIGGVWKKVGEEELLAIESAVRILV
ncbi:hypothetical protein HHK36_011765 [Tetracentron sinense]|uniref:Uncharacterized protein n=1 Tax=Tetracentron sinense TaxID=13715 RepID=A0A834ZC92_TETSI|nr:hypothetical protein HHK36_011765 [Tetracentron sinense]